MQLSHLLLLTIAAAPLAPNDVLRAAVADLAAHVAPHERPGVRYVTFHHLPPADRAHAGAVLSWTLNTVSRADAILRPEPVPQTFGALWRIRWTDYQLPADVWELLASRDPYFHIRTQVLATAAGPRRATSRNVVSAAAATTEIFTDGGWIDLPAAARLARTLRQRRSATSRRLLPRRGHDHARRGRLLRARRRAANRGRILHIAGARRCDHRQSAG
ncbi:MAG: hypothetical protein QM775_35015 [Pirellulales bacterium]